MGMRSGRGYPLPASQVWITRPTRAHTGTKTEVVSSGPTVTIDEYGCGCEGCREEFKVLFGDPEIKAPIMGILKA